MNSTRKVKLSKRLLWLYHDAVDYLLRDKNGQVVLMQVPNAPLIIFMIAVILGIVLYPGILQTAAWIVAILSILYWSYAEMRSGINRLRRGFGTLMIFMVIIAVVLYLIPQL